MDWRIARGVCALRRGCGALCRVHLAPCAYAKAKNIYQAHASNLIFCRKCCLFLRTGAAELPVLSFAKLLSAVALSQDRLLQVQIWQVWYINYRALLLRRRRRIRARQSVAGASQLVWHGIVSEAGSLFVAVALNESVARVELMLPIF